LSDFVITNLKSFGVNRLIYISLRNPLLTLLILPGVFRGLWQ